MEKVNYEIFRDNMNIPYLREVEYNECWLHFHRNIEMIYVVDGELEGKIDDTEYIFLKDDIVFIPNYLKHIFFKKNYSKVIILVVPYDLGNDFQDLFKNNQFDIKLSDKTFNKKILETLRSMQKNYDLNSPLINKGYLDAIMGQLLYRYPRHVAKHNHNLNFIIEVLEYIEKNYYKKLDLQTLSKTFGYNKDYFSKVFNRCVGVNINTYINHIRIANALNLIKKDDNKNILDNALAVGFESSATFYRAFKMLYHTTPVEYLQSENK